MELKANINYDRPLNNTSVMTVNFIFNSNKYEIILKADINIKDKIEIENPTKIILLTDMDSKRLKTNMKIINEKILSTFAYKLKNLNLIKE